MNDATSTLVEQVAAVGALLTELLTSVAGMPEPDPALDERCRTDDRLRELVVGLEKVRNATEATQAAAMAAMGAEARRMDAAEFAATGMPSRSFEEFVPDEIAALLSCTHVAASHRYGTALDADRYPAVRAAWQSGHIDSRTVSMLAEQLAPLERDDAARLADAAVGHATNHTTSQTREWLRRRVIAVNPNAAEERRKTAHQERRVVITPGDDGMSDLWARLPSMRARQIQQALTQAAHELGADDLRSMDQRRADLLVHWLLGDNHAPTVHLHVLAPASEEPGWVPGVGPVTTQQLDELIAEGAQITTADHRRRMMDTHEPERHYRPSSGLEQAVRYRDVTCRFPGCRRPALGGHTGTDLDHTIPWPEGATEASNLSVLCRRHHRLKHSPHWQVQLKTDATMTWTTPTGRLICTEPWQHASPTDRSESDPDPPPLE
jgi:hypothetical protein